MHDSSMQEGTSYEPLQEPPLQGPPVGDSSVEIPPLKPSNWLWQSILVTIFCCLPFGIIGIVYAVKVDSLYYRGQYAESERFARKAKMWTLISLVTALVYYVVSIILVVTGNLPGYIENIIENNASGYNF